MESQVITVNTSGDLHIPIELQEMLGLGPGVQVQVTVYDGQLIARPLHAHLPRRPRMPKSDATALLQELKGLFAGQPSLEEEARANRDPDKW